MKTASICCVLFISVIYVTNAQKSCTTPDNKSGVCVPYKQCQPLNDFFKKLTSLTKAQTVLIQELIKRCGADGICCVTALEPSRDLLPAPGACGVESDDRIFGGEIASITDHPWIALLEYAPTIKRPRNNFLCGGTLINKNYVITAAHCMSKIKPISVRLGEHNLLNSPDCEEQEYDYDTTPAKKTCADKEKDIKISEIIVHKQYDGNKTQHNDIALIRLSQSVAFTDYIKPICLPTAPHLKSKINFDRETLFTSGFGRTEYESSSDIKLELTIPGFNWNECDELYRKKSRVVLGENELCAGGEAGRDTCNGDSGGPLIAVDRTMRELPYSYLVGVVSRISIGSRTT